VGLCTRKLIICLCRVSKEEYNDRNQKEKTQ